MSFQWGFNGERAHPPLIFTTVERLIGDELRQTRGNKPTDVVVQDGRSHLIEFNGCRFNGVPMGIVHNTTLIIYCIFKLLVMNYANLVSEKSSQILCRTPIILRTEMRHTMQLTLHVTIHLH